MTLCEHELGPRLVHLTGVRFEFAARRFEQDEWHIAGRAPSDDVGVGRTSDLETDAVAAHRWWSLDQLSSSSETIYPVQLQTIVRAFLSGGIPDMPLELEDHPE